MTPNARGLPAALLALLSVALPLCARSLAEGERRLVIFHAGSLTVPFDRIIADFKAEHPGVEVIREVAGSRECARKISELHKPCDVLAVADYEVIDQLLIPEHAAWSLKFAGNELAIVYTDKSRRAAELTSKNWLDILADQDVAIGRSDPEADPCGYRTVIALKLAELHYRRPGLADKLLGKSNTHSRPKEVDLLALLQAGELDYLFLYRSVAQQHGLRWLALPDQINLKKPEREGFYRKASIQLHGKTPAELVTQYGSAIAYGVTIPKNVANPELANEFIRFLLDKDKGLKTMERLGQPSLVPAPTSTYEQLPKDLKVYARRSPR
ncbi:MAG: extracellular solute-binding protein [Elusimicrobia bacterium]|nr:extracellular solute-binding protein [Elusimicrobiota bacterium]